jgi:hypothetical protein
MRVAEAERAAHVVAGVDWYRLTVTCACGLILIGKSYQETARLHRDHFRQAVGQDPSTGVLRDESRPAAYVTPGQLAALAKIKREADDLLAAARIRRELGEADEVARALEEAHFHEDVA